MVKLSKFYTKKAILLKKLQAKFDLGIEKNKNLC